MNRPNKTRHIYFELKKLLGESQNATNILQFVKNCSVEI